MNTKFDANERLTEREASEYTGITINALRHDRYVRANPRIPFHLARDGKHIFYLAGELDAYLASRSTTTTAAA